MTLFKVNPKLEQVAYEIVLDSVVFTVDNFYEDPDEVVEFIMGQETPLHREGERLSQNGVAFEDRRLNTSHEGMAEVTQLLMQLSEQDAQFAVEDVSAERYRFLTRDDNPYEDRVWNPTKTPGYVAFVYLNSGTYAGTNLYAPQTIYPTDGLPQHAAPWKSRHLWPILKSITAKYNRMVMFDGNKFVHGMAVNDDRFFDEERVSQIMFFTPSQNGG